MTIDELLSSFRDAIASADTKRMEDLFLVPDATEDGQNRQANINEFRKDWAEIEKGPPVVFNAKDAVIHIEMDDLDPDGPPGGHVTTIELKIVYTDHGWRIRAMR
jgi:hypothetical protein